jgi:hypothetical protein
MRSAPFIWWTLLFVPLSFPPLLDKMVDDEATNEQDDEGHNTENLIPHPPAPSFSASWRLCLYFFCSWYHTTGCSCGVVLTWQGVYELCVGIQPTVGADYAVSKIDTDYEIGLCAAMASSIIHMNF